MRARCGSLVSASWIALLASSAPRPAEACGSCVHEPAGVNVAVVTDHRIVLSLAADRTVIWDQFRSAGDGAGFAWMYPVRDRNAVDVRVGSESFVDAIDEATAVGFEATCVRGAISSTAIGGPVAVRSSFAASPAVVMPVSVDRIDGSDLMNVIQWIADNGYVDPGADRTAPDAAIGGPVVPDAIRQYAALHMDFVAVRFAPTPGVQQMPPVRIVEPGYDPTLPLRGVAVGIGDEVGLTLIVMADTRMQPSSSFAQKFLGDAPPQRASSAGEAYTLAYRALRLDQPDAWVTESAPTLAAMSFAAFQPLFGDGGLDGGMLTADDREDADLAFAGQSVRVATRLRAILATTALGRDLSLEPAPDRVVPRVYTYLDPTLPSSACVGDAGTIAWRTRDPGCLCRAPGAPADARGSWSWLVFAAAATRGLRRTRARATAARVRRQ